MKIFFTSAVLVLIANLSHAEPLQGWRFPDASDIVGDWRLYEAEMPSPFHVSGDFDGDGGLDHAWILLRSNQPGWGLFVILGEDSADRMVIELFRSEADGAQHFGLDLLEPGEYVTACGKGHWECSELEPPELILTNPSFAIFKFESASTIYYWDSSAKAFKNIAQSD